MMGQNTNYEFISCTNKGLEKVISTIGIHELRGYGRLYSSIGLHEEIANILQITNFLGSNDLAFSLESLAEDAQMRANDYNNPKVRMRKSFHIFPRIWKAIGDVAKETLMMITVKN